MIFRPCGQAPSHWPHSRQSEAFPPSAVALSTNSYYAPLADGSCHDWIEFHNVSDKPVNLKGCMLSDKAKTANKWSVPTDLILEPDGFGVIYLSGLDKVLAARCGLDCHMPETPGLCTGKGMARVLQDPILSDLAVKKL